ncbi:MAG TPA: pseudouridine synthase [Usitatibacter sp.]|nr:pseudouridine synthase [Usitatibacter sp.]
MILFNKPHGVICQFSESGTKPTLAGFIRVRDVYPAGRLDTDSEGLVVLTADGALQTRIADPRRKLEKVYWAQVEGEVTEEALERLAGGVELNDGPTLPARARTIPLPALGERDPPIRFRKAVPTSWIELAIREGRNRQVRRMTAAVGLPTLRLYRFAVGPWNTQGLAPGRWREADAAELADTGG